MFPVERSRKPKIRILFADDHSQVRKHLVARLMRESDLEVVGVARNSTQLLQEAIAKQPELLLIDPMMRDGLGLATLRQICATLPGTSVVVLTAVVDTTLKLQLREMGIKHILVKGILSSKLISELRTAS